MTTIWRKFNGANHQPHATGYADSVEGVDRACRDAAELNRTASDGCGYYVTAPTALLDPGPAEGVYLAPERLGADIVRSVDVYPIDELCVDG